MENNYREINLYPYASFIRVIGFPRQFFMAPVLLPGTDYHDSLDFDSGIWQGRFQVIHNGHYHVFEDSLSKFPLKMIAIVDPNPNIEMRPCDYENFLNPDDNPFTYFQRMFLWKMIEDDYNKNHPSIQVIMFPCWHAQEHLEFEKSEFLPSSRAWIVPFKQSADTSNDPQAKKAYHLHQKMRERVYRAPLEVEDNKTIDRGQRKSFDEKPLSELHASKVRALLDSIRDSDSEYTKCVPLCIKELQKRFYLNLRAGEDAFKGINVRFIAVPYIGNEIDLYSLQEAVSQVKKEENSYIVFVVSVRVQKGQEKWVDESRENTPWWFKSAAHDMDGHNLIYLRKAEMLTKLMKNLGLTNYFITPIFLLGDDFSSLSEYNSAFLPPMKNTKWLININERRKRGNGYYKFGFLAYLTNMDANTQTFEAFAIDSVISSFFNNEAYHKFLNVDQKKIVIDTATRTSLEARVPMLKQSLLELVGSPNPPERATEYLQQVRTIKNRLIEGWDSEEEFQQDQSKLNDIDNWLRKIV